MLRSLHLKLMLIMLLLITSLMTVVGAFLMTNISSFYTKEFYTQMDEMFGQDNAAFVNDLRSGAAESGSVEQLQAVLEPLGIQLKDHIIVADTDFVSMRDNGFLP